MADVICPSCAGRYHETTALYRPEVATRGDMLRLKKFYRDNGWDSFPETHETAFGDLECPDCGGRYTDNGIVRIDTEQYCQEIEWKEYLATHRPVDVDRKEFMGTQYANGKQKEPKRTGRTRKEA